MSGIKRVILWSLALGLAAAVLLGSVFISYTDTQRFVDATLAANHSREVVDAAIAVLASVKDAETGQRGYLLTEDAQYLEPYNKGMRDIAESLGKLKILVADSPDQTARVAALEALIAPKLAELKSTLAVLDSGLREPALALMRTDIGMNLMQNIRDRIADFVHTERDRQAVLDTELLSLYQRSRIARVAGALIGLALIAIAIALVLRDQRIRRRAAIELKSEKEWFSTTLRSIGDGVIVTDADGRIVMMNAVAENLTAWSSGEAAGRPLLEVFKIVNETTREAAEDPVRRALNEGAIVGLANHTVLLARDGREYVIEDSAAPTYNANGVLQGAVMVFHDATERHRTERNLAQANAELARRGQAARVHEQTLNTILDNAQIGICMTGPAPNFPIIAISRQMREWIGSLPDSTPAHTAYQKLQPDGQEVSPERLPIHRATVLGEVVRSEPWLVKSGNQGPLLVLVNVAPVRDANDVIVGAVHSWVEVGERQRLDHALRVSQSRLQVLVQSNVIGLILHCHRDGSLRDANDAFLRMLGYSTQEMTAGEINLIAVTPPEYQETYATAMAELAATGVCTPFETELVRKDGSRISVVMGYARMGDALDEYVGFALDVTHQKELESQLRQRTEALLLADRRKDEFLAMLAHELRNPLAPIRNAVHVLETDAVQSRNATARKLLPMMRRQIEHLVRLVDDLLDAARISEGKLVMERKPVELQQSLRTAIETVEVLIQNRGQRLDLQLPPNPLYVTGDAMRLAQTFGNILHNAAKYTQQGRHIDVSLVQESDSAALRVRDDGQGIAADLLPHIFETFVQADQSLARSAGGIGVGLSLVRRVVELHGGRVEASSAGPGLGSEFLVRLPIAQAPVSIEPLAQMESKRTTSTGKRVLIVDDNADLAASTAALFELWGHVSHTVDDGERALSAAHEFHPDVILLDIGLPGLDGFEIARLLRAEPDFTRTTLIAMTGYGQASDRAKALLAGFDAHLIKPVQPGDLKALLDRY